MMSSQLTYVLYAAVQSPILVALVASLFFLILLPALRGGGPLSSAVQRNAAIALTTASIGLLALYALLLGWYLSIENFAGEVEPTVTSVSWVAAHGAPLYHGMETAARYSVLYGPAIFLINGWMMMLLGPSVAAAKAAGVLAGASSMLFLYLSLRSRLRRRESVWLCSLAVLLYFVHGPFSYLSRPDPLLLSASAFALFCATRLGRWGAMAGLAAAIALSVNMKIHGIVYMIVPLLILLDRHGARTVLISLTLSLGLILSPFAMSNVSLPNYLHWLAQATHHGLDRTTFLHTFRFAVLLFLPVLILATARSRPLPRAIMAGLVASFALTLVFAAKPGAGLNHLLPLIPPTLYVLAAQLRALRTEANYGLRELGALRQAALLGSLATMLFVGSVAEAKCLKRLQAGSELGPRVVSDLQGILHRYPDRTIAMAYGGEGGHYELTFYRPHLLFAGQPLPLDIISLMDSQRAANEIPSETYRALDDGAIELWLVPRGASPFMKRNWYPPHQNVFPQEFVALLRERYRNLESTEFYDIWFFQGSPEAVPASTGSLDATYAPKP